MSRGVEDYWIVQQEPCNGFVDTDTFAATTLVKRLEVYVKSFIENMRAEINSRILPALRARFAVMMMDEDIRMLVGWINELQILEGLDYLRIYPLANIRSIL